MPVNPAAILGPWPMFCNTADENTTIDDAAAELASEIVNFFATAQVLGPTPGAPLTKGLTASPIESAIKSDLKALESKESSMLPIATDFMGTANAIAAQLGTIQISPMPAQLPIIAPTSGYAVTLGGVGASLAPSFAAAMAQLDPALTANLLVVALTTHAKTVTGLYNGLYPSPTGPIPGPPMPWVGLL